MPTTNTNNDNNSPPPSPSSPPPTPAEITSLASTMGYKERRPQISCTIFLQEINPEHAMPPVLLNIYYTTKSIMSFLNHPTQGVNELWRSNAYRTVEELQTFLENPRIHSGKGYRKKENAVRGCAKCGAFLKRTEFSLNQWKKGPDYNICKNCVKDTTNSNTNTNRGGGGGGGHNNNNNRSIISSTDDTWTDVVPPSSSEDDMPELCDAFDSSLDITDKDTTDDSDFPSLTSDLLNKHNSRRQQQPPNNNTNNNNNLRMERRQFNCPECPKHNRGKYVFFKKVPIYKPLIKCPQCKRVTRGRCKRLHPVPKQNEKGYGLFLCKKCKCTWGSSRAVRGIGQECAVCRVERGETVFAKPFRLEIVKHKNRGSNNSSGGMRRVPRHALGEDQEVNVGYTDIDRVRNANDGNNALLRGGGGRGRRGGGGGGYSDGSSTDDDSYVFEPREESSQESSSSTSSELPRVRPVTTNPTTPAGYVHYCQGCATGICKSRYLPKSQLHDVSDGNTVSTSGTVVTNSSIDKSDYMDRDEDFTGFEDCDEE